MMEIVEHIYPASFVERTQIVENERRQNNLTDDDIARIVEAVKSSYHHCSFSSKELETLRGLAQGVSKTQKIASYMIITAIVGATFGGIGKAIYYYVFEVLMKRVGQ
jgi:hypothetical protein